MTPPFPDLGHPTIILSRHIRTTSAQTEIFVMPAMPWSSPFVKMSALFSVDMYVNFTIPFAVGLERA